MRVLATIAFSFAAGLFLILLLPWSGWYLWAAAGVGLSALVLRLWAKNRRWSRRGQLILWPLAAALVYFTAYQAAVRHPQCSTVDGRPVTVFPRIETVLAVSLEPA